MFLFRHAYTLDCLRETLVMEEHRSISGKIAQLFIDRFDLSNLCQGEAFETRRDEIRAKIDETVQTSVM